MDVNKFYGIGVGVGDPSMLTLKAIETLKKIDVVILPEAKTGEGSTAYKIASKYLKENIEKVFLEFTMAKDEEIRKISRKKNTNIIEDYLKSGKNVAFLTIGDPMVYSTYSYILQCLDEKYIVETLCGIPTFIDIASMLNIPLALGNESLKIISLNEETDIKKEIENSDNIVFMKVSRNFNELKKALKVTNNMNNILMVSNCGKENQKIYWNIEELDNKDVEYFTTLILKTRGISQWKKFSL
ncbi:MAG: precorrin-2 C(20)-methyltransferase [Fusobacteriaceae bacterium]